jgi:hypothetical protein
MTDTFRSDAERRTLGHLQVPDGDPYTVEALEQRMAPDAHSDLDAGELSELLEDLEARGLAKKTKGGWKMTAAGLEALNG